MGFYKTLASQVDYNRDTGVFVWKKRIGKSRSHKAFNSQFAGKEAGNIHPSGYRHIHVTDSGKSTHIRAHRLAWFICYGSGPKDQIDHINRNKLDNRINNLREVSNTQNQHNASRRKDNKSGVSGVYWDKSKSKWRASVRVNSIRHYVGLFDELDSASNAVLEFRAKHNFSPTHGL